ncbi:MAG: N-acetyl sugar amidotransferase [Chlorobium phaeovibrioides]|nr:N-acetyl sugar amidotransferase [Chlorobium phaeovibrioides]
MQTCTRCLYTSHHPLQLTFDEQGVCSGCRVHEEKDQLDWSERGKKLGTILESYRNRSGNNYDCIIPVSGGRDSFFIVHTIKHVYGMNPLLVTYNKQYNTDVGVRNLANLRIRFDCDIMTQTVNPEVVKKITRSTFRRFGSIYWHCLAGQTAYPVQVAVKFKIPLIIWGAHQGVDQVGMFSHLNEVEMTRKYRKEHDLMGYEAEDLIDDFDNITEPDIMPFRYPDDIELERVGVRGIYLNNYIRWDSRTQHEQMIQDYGYETAPQTRTFDTYNDVDCWNYSDVHDYIKFVKHGYGKVTDHACREIRLRHMSREQGLELVRQYNHRPLKNLKLFLDWLDITENAFHFIIDQHRNSKCWQRNINWEWELINNVQEALFQSGDAGVALQLREPHRDFLLTHEGWSTDVKDDYILIGKGIG